MTASHSKWSTGCEDTTENIDGSLMSVCRDSMQMAPLSQEEMERLLFPILTERMRRILDETGGADFAHVIGNPCP